MVLHLGNNPEEAGRRSLGCAVSWVMAVKDAAAAAENNQISVVVFTLAGAVEHEDRRSTFAIRSVTFDPLGEARVSFGVA